MIENNEIVRVLLELQKVSDFKGLEYDIIGYYQDLKSDFIDKNGSYKAYIGKPEYPVLMDLREDYLLNCVNSTIEENF